MAELSGIFSSQGFTEVTTYIQSGNVLFSSESGSLDQIATQIESQLVKSMDNKIPVIVRSVNALETLINQNPFDRYDKDQEVQFYVCFLKDRPQRIPALPLISLRDGLEIFQITDLYAFIVSRKVKGRFGFPNNFVEKALDVQATTRNWNTIIKMISK